MTLKWENIAKHSKNIVTSELKDDIRIQLKLGQFYEAVTRLCANVLGIIQDTNDVSIFLFLLLLFL